MQRLPNPGSEPDEFIRNFRGTYSALKSFMGFSLDDVTATMIRNRAVTSQGAVGKEALRRSTRVDRSRDPLYNQSKMYAELYRTLGWIHSVSGALRFAFTPLGAAVAEVGDPKPLVHQCLLGIAYPNEVLGIRSEHNLRVFSVIMQSMAALGFLSRDEIMVGPQSISDDRDKSCIRQMLQEILAFRQCPGALDNKLNQMAAALGIKRTPSMENYTRFPMAFLPWTGWAAKPKPGTLAITPGGMEMVKGLERMIDFRISDFNALPIACQPAAIRHGLATMLARANVAQPKYLMLSAADLKQLQSNNLNSPDFYFSPFQQLSNSTISKHCPELGTSTAGEAPTLILEIKPVERTKVETRLIAKTDSPLNDFRGRVLSKQSLLTEIARARGDIEAASLALSERFSSANQDVFYPLVGDLFTATGLNCQVSRRGVNALRADAVIIDSAASIPIEIKSPGEESEISVKAVRQALENKIVFLSRGTFPTQPETTSLAVGYNLPADRSDVYELIEDIRTAFGITIGLVDITTLFRLACYAVKESRKIRYANLKTLSGAAKLTIAD